MKLQELRARQACAEIDVPCEVKIDHHTPETIVNGKVYTLLFPRFILDYAQKKDIFLSFMGNITKERKIFLDNFPEATILESQKGRNEKTRDNDKEYFNTLARSMFSLVPNGTDSTRELNKIGDPELAWTYRFFESCMLSTIPVVEESLNVYNGYYYYTKDDELVYKEEWAKHNLEKVKQEMML